MVEFMFKIRCARSSDNCKNITNSLKKYFGNTLKNEPGNFYEHVGTTNIFTHSAANKLVREIEEAHQGMIESIIFKPTDRPI